MTLELIYWIIGSFVAGLLTTFFALVWLCRSQAKAMLAERDARMDPMTRMALEAIKHGREAKLTVNPADDDDEDMPPWDDPDGEWPDED